MSDGGFSPRCITCGAFPAMLSFEHGEDGPYCTACVARANAAAEPVTEFVAGETHELVLEPFEANLHIPSGTLTIARVDAEAGRIDAGGLPQARR